MKGHMKERTPGSWTIWVDLGKDASGKRRQKTFTVKGTKRAAQREMTRILAELQSGGFVEPSKLTTAQFLRQWLETYASPKVGPRTLERYEEIIDRHLIPALGAVPLAKLTALQVQAYYTEALRAGRRDGKGGLSAQTVLHHHRLLNCALRWAIRWQVLARNPLDAVEPPRPDHREMNALDEDGTAHLLAVAAGTRLYLPALLAVTTTMRLGEILGLRWEDVDLSAGTVLVRRTLQQTRQGVIFKEPKTERSRRRIHLPPVTVEALANHKKAQVAEDPANVIRLPVHLVVCQADGTPWPPKNLSKSFEHLAERAGCPQIRFHDLRHSGASQLLKLGVPIGVVSERLGHARTSTTQDIYAHVLPGMQEDAARKMDEALRAAMEQRRASSG